jgi:mRNA interferase MazF
MPITFFPDAGDILICDFYGFVAPEMIKQRPVVVLSPRRRRAVRLCTVIPLSTTTPTPIECHHILIPQGVYPMQNEGKQQWAKCDMLYTVSYDRLDRVKTTTAGRRTYCVPKMPSDILQKIRQAVKISHNL